MPPRRRHSSKTFEPGDYARFSAAELQCMGYGALSLMAVLCPARFENRDFASDEDFLEAADRACVELRKMFHAKPYRRDGYDQRGYGRFLNDLVLYKPTARREPLIAE